MAFIYRHRIQLTITSRSYLRRRLRKVTTRVVNNRAHKTLKTYDDSWYDMD